VKNLPGRKTDIGDAEWLAMLSRAGLLRGSFVPEADHRAFRLVSRQRQKLVGILASEKNRLHKVLTDSGIRLGVVVINPATFYRTPKSHGIPDMTGFLVPRSYTPLWPE
jgi:hypothetical protein